MAQSMKLRPPPSMTVVNPASSILRQLSTPINAAALSAEQYQHAVDALAPRLAELPRGEEWLDSLLCLLESYLSPFPSSTNTAESPDVSLYDHLKTTAAVGACICEYLHEKGERDYKKVLFDNEKSFMDEGLSALFRRLLRHTEVYLHRRLGQGAALTAQPVLLP